MTLHQASEAKASSDAASILEAARSLYITGQSAQLLERAQTAWAAHQGDLRTDDAAHLGEVMRMAALASRIDDERAATVWLARARALFVKGGSGTGVALTMLLDLYRLLREDGPGPTALAVLDAVEACVDESVVPLPRKRALSLIAEKRAFVLLEAARGQSDSGQLDAPRAEYERALSLSDDDRRRLKIRAALVTVDLEAGDIDRAGAAAQLEELQREAGLSGVEALDVTAVMAENVRRLGNGVEALASYEPI